jgi:hypothetical protein
VKLRLLALALAGAVSAATASPQKAPPDAAATPATLVYYFHATTRCATCRTIEAYAHETVSSRFSSDLQARRLEWRAVNVDEPANRHFIRDFRLYTRSVVVVDAKDPKRFKVLDRVWQLVRNKPAFQAYVEQEIRSFPRS